MGLPPGGGTDAQSGDARPARIGYRIAGRATRPDRQPSGAAMTEFQPADADWEARCRAHFARQRIMQTLHCALTVLRPGYCELEMPFDPAYTQQDGVLQAGVPAILGDNAGGYAAYSLYPPGANILAVEFKINFLAPGKGDRIRACARVVKNGRTLCVNDIDIYAVTDGKAKPIAKMQQTGMRVDAAG
jgi:uncharacterized protein (TIGR00369 family)